MTTMQQRIATMRAEADAAVAAVSSPEFIAEEADRKAFIEQAERKASARARAREVLIERMLDAFDGQAVEAVAIDAMPHAFVVKAAGAAAYRKMQQGIQDAATGAVAKGTRAKIKLDDVNHAYTLKGVAAWNADGKDMAIDDEESTDGAALDKFLRDNPGVLGQLMTAIQRLDGAASEARKR
jgi:hypothetical protein